MSLYESIKQGLNEAIEYEKGNLSNVKIDKIAISPVVVFTPDRIKTIRSRHSMTQRLFAKALGVSIKTVEAWESGKNAPSGCANRMLELLEYDNGLLERSSILARH